MLLQLISNNIGLCYESGILSVAVETNPFANELKGRLKKQKEDIYADPNLLILKSNWK